MVADRVRLRWLSPRHHHLSGMVDLSFNEGNNSPLHSRDALGMVRMTTITSNVIKG